jgi:NADH-quinone oxidoreductase E subunit
MTGNGAGGDDGFAFTSENREKATAFIAKYPEGRQQSAVLPLLDLAQRQNGGWLSRAAIEHVAQVLEMPVLRVEEVVSFYVMLLDRPVGKHVVWVCTTTPCWLRGSDGIVAKCRETLGVDFGETTEDGMFTLLEQECLGACCNAPMVQIDDDYYEDLTPESIEAVLCAFRAGETPAPGSQAGRRGSTPAGGPTTLTTLQREGSS